MAASSRTINTLADVLVDELGADQALRVIRVVQRKVTGNKSYRDTMERLENQIVLASKMPTVFASVRQVED